MSFNAVHTRADYNADRQMYDDRFADGKSFRSEIRKARGEGTELASTLPICLFLIIVEQKKDLGERKSKTYSQICYLPRVQIK